MKILLFTDADVFAGTERHMLDLAIGLRAERLDVCIGCPVPGALATRAKAAGVQVIPIAKRGRLDWRAILQVRGLCRDHGFNVIHSHNGRTAFLAAIATSLAGTGQCVVTQHFLAPSYATRRGLKGKISRALHRWVDRRTNHLIAISQATCRGSVARGEATVNDITVIPNGIVAPDLTRLQSAPAIRAELGIAPEAPLVVCVARLEAEKDIAALIDAMAEVVRGRGDAICMVAGDGSLKADLQARIDRLGLQRSVRLIGFRSDVMSLVNACDVFVLPSVAEPFGLVLLEAMSLGKPVVATAAGGPMEIVEQGRTGLLVPPGNAREMAAAIERLLSSAALREAMSQAGEARYRAEYTVERMAAATIEVYRRVMNQPANHEVAVAVVPAHIQS